jgi:hypothetical protein
MEKFKLKVNNIDKIEQLLQETYNLACQQYTVIQDEMNKVANATKVKDLDIEGKEKYSKIMANYLALQQKSIVQKYDIAKLMSDIIKYNGNIDDAIADSKKNNSSLDIGKLRALAKQAQTGGNDEVQVYETKN